MIRHRLYWTADPLPDDVTMYYGPSQTQARQRLLDSSDSRVKTIFTAVQEFNKAGPGEHLRLPHLFDISLDGGSDSHLALESFVVFLLSNHLLSSFTRVDRAC